MLHIFTLTWNALPMLATLKASLLPALEGLEYRWHIKDNGSNDFTSAAVETWVDEGPIVGYAYPNNLQNFSEGMNYLYQQAAPKDDDYILLLNNDVEFLDAESIRNMIAALKPNVGIVGARLLFTGTERLQHAGVVFNETHLLPIHFRAGEMSDEEAQKNRYFQAVTGAVMLTRGEYYRQVCTTNKSGIPGLDERLIWCFDDIDMCLSVKNNLKKEVVYCGRTAISHRESASLKKNPINKLFLNPNVKYFRQKWHGKYSPDLRLYTNHRDLGVVV